ncbi:MAG: fimbrillin family protein [Prevotella sp.]|nr:fimbrillin family protein [Prevotella sp.]
MNRILKAFYAGATLLILGCAAEDKLSDNTLPGEEKTPLRVEATLAADNALTRAEGKQFEAGDVLLAYLRHTTGGSKGGYTTTAADKAPLLAAFKKGSATMAGDATKLETADLTSVLPNDPTTPAPLYWDDFSNSATTATYLRTSGHGLQSFYGYCFNGGATSTDGSATGGNLTTALDPAAGTLGWTLPTTQNTAAIVKGSDLLWSAEQETVVYNHNTTQAADHSTLTIPYTHAMSQVTVTIIANDGFSTTTNPLASTTLTLNAMNTVASLTAPTGGYSSTTPAAVTMYRADNSYKKEGEDVYRRDFTAIVAPGTKLTAGTKLLDITNVEDNNYKLNITAAILAAGAGKWLSQLNEKTDAGTYYETKPGVNYHLDVTVNKTKIEVVATIQDWTTVNATGTGEIQFDNDIVTLDVTGNSFADNSSFSLFQRGSTVTGTTNDNYAFTTVSEYSATETKWTNSHTIYWPNKSTSYFFRALAKLDGTDANKIISVGTYDTDKGTAVTQGTIADGHDILWATTPAHNRHGEEGSYTYDYDRGAAIAPRTGNVPLAFEHAMSKVTFILETSGAEDDTATPEYAPVDDNNAKVDLRNATISISNLYTGGNISIDDGSIAPSDNNTDDGDGPADGRTVAAISRTATSDNLVKRLTVIDQYIVIPQNIGNDAVITITLKDQSDNVTATYKLNLNECLVSGSTTSITQWQRGQHYIYTIHIEKEQITFRVLIKEWEEKQGSGNANLEWD